MVRCLIQLGRNLEAFENLERALKYGAAPLEETVYNEAIAYQKLLASQVGDLQVTCKQDGVHITLDGAPLATCPAQEKRRVLAGPHQIVGTKAGLATETRELVVIGGAPLAAEITLAPLAKGAKVVHRWPVYIPWTVFGGGLAAGGAGALFLITGHGQMRSYDEIVDARCTGRCTPAELADVRDLYDSARFNSGLGLGLAITGSAAVLTGAAMLFLNRGRTVYPESAPVVTPTPGGAAITWSGSF
jgi:hypothetical protein